MRVAIIVVIAMCKDTKRIALVDNIILYSVTIMTCDDLSKTARADRVICVYKVTNLIRSLG